MCNCSQCQGFEVGADAAAGMIHFRTQNCLKRRAAIRFVTAMSALGLLIVLANWMLAGA